MNFKLETVQIEDKHLFDDFIGKDQSVYAPINASEYNFTNIFMWRKHYGFRYVVDGNFLVVMAFPEDNVPFALFPVGNGSEEELDEVIDRIKDFFIQRDCKAVIRRVPEDSVKYFVHRQERQQNFNAVLEEDRNNSDYIYLASDMRNLKGKKYDGKRNHINKFKRLYSHEYMPLEYKYIEDCIRVEEEWCNARSCSKENGLLQEKEAILEALRNYEQLGYQGGIVKVNDRVEAFTLGESLNSNTAVIHIEKANANIEGLYTYINHKFCGDRWGDAEYINREQDLGVEGIRKAKLSYHPVKIVEKYSVIL